MQFATVRRCLTFTMIGFAAFHQHGIQVAAQQCDTEVTGEIFCDDFESSSSNTAWNSINSFAADDGVMKLSGRDVPVLLSRQSSSRDVSMIAVGRVLGKGGAGIGVRGSGSTSGGAPTLSASVPRMTKRLQASILAATRSRNFIATTI